MKYLLAILLIVPAFAFADQRTTDFCLKYLGEELQPKQITGYRPIPMPNNQSIELVQPIYRGSFSIYSTMRSR